MIQRLQTVWLLLAAICMALTFKFKFAVGQIIENTVPTLKHIKATTHITSLIFASAFVLLTIFVIFSFKNRKMQMRLSLLNILIGLGVIYFLYTQTKPLNDITYAVTAVLPIFAIGFTISGLHCIRQDEKLIKESNSDRIR